MRPYEKPRLVALSLDGNERLCGYCSEDIKDNPTFYYGIYPVFDENGNQVLDKEDFTAIFGAAESCEFQPQGFEHYCKFTSSPTTVLAWS